MRFLATVRQGVVAALTEGYRYRLDRSARLEARKALAARAVGRAPLSQELTKLEVAASHPALPPKDLATNRASLSKLRAFLASLSSPTGYPPAQLVKLDFVVRSPEGRTHVARGMVRTTGGDCAAVVEAGLGDLLRKAGLESQVFLDRGEFEGGRKAFEKAYQQSLFRKAVGGARKERGRGGPGGAQGDAPLEARPASDVAAELGRGRPLGGGGVGGGARDPATFPGDRAREGGPSPSGVPSHAPPGSAAFEDMTRSSDPREAAALRAAAEAGSRIAAARAAAAEAGVQSQMITQEQFDELSRKREEKLEESIRHEAELEDWQRKLAELDPLLGLLAAVPWIDPSDERARYARGHVLDRLEGLGWDIRGAVSRVWAGERDLEALASGRDAGSKAAIQAVLFYSRQNDDKYGSKAAR